jgi:hypothetical protein
LSLAFSTLVIALFALMPGLFFEHFLYAGKMSRIRATTPTLTDLAASVGLSIPIHIVTLWGLEKGDLLRAPVDYDIFVQALTGQFGNGGLDRLAASLRDDHLPIALYLLATASVGLLLGQVTQYLILTFSAFYRLLPFRNRWFSTFFFYSGQRASFCEASILTKSAAENRPLLYLGTVNDFEIGPGGELIEIRLGGPHRAFLKAPIGLAETPDPGLATPDPAPGEWRPLAGDVFILPNEQISNLNFKYYYGWRPMVILARLGLTLPAGTSEPCKQVDLLAESPWWRLPILRLFPVPEKFFIVPKASGAQVGVEVQGYKITLKANEALLADAEFQVVGVWQSVVDARHDKTGNFFFWVDQKLREVWSRWIEGRANSWH